METLSFLHLPNKNSMAPKEFSLQINKPCSENWNAMSEQEQGRFCSNCKTVVMDFTGMSTHEILSFFKDQTKEICGRFQMHQLETIYSLSLRKNPWYMHRFLQYAISGLLTLKLADGAAQTPVAKTEIKAGQKEEDKKIGSTKTDDKNWIEGIVLYQNSPLPDATVTLSGTEQSFQTDEEGKFRFELPKDFTAKEFSLRFYYSGYGSQTRYFTYAQLPIKNLTVELEIRHLMGKVARPKLKY
jgi:hypothetical protein